MSKATANQLLALPVTVVGALVLSVIFFSPVIILAWWLHRSRERSKAEMLEPFTTLPLRPPGESLRLEIDELKDRLDEFVVRLLLTSLAGTFLVFAVRP